MRRKWCNKVHQCVEFLLPRASQTICAAHAFVRYKYILNCAREFAIVSTLRSERVACVGLVPGIISRCILTSSLLALCDKSSLPVSRCRILSRMSCCNFPVRSFVVVAEILIPRPLADCASKRRVSFFCACLSLELERRIHTEAEIIEERLLER